MRGTHTLSAVVVLLVLAGPVFAYRQVIDLWHGTAYSINDKGQIAGVEGDAVVFDPGTSTHLELGALNDPYYRSMAYSINNNGQIVGRATSTRAPDRKACLFDPTGNKANIDLGNSEAYSINDNGQIVGYTTTIDPVQRATLFDPTGNGQNKDLGTLGGDISEARSINNKGQIVGNATGATLNTAKACLFDSTGGGANVNLGTPDNLGTLDDYLVSVAYAINENSQIVGYSEFRFPTGGTRAHACLFDSTGGGANIDLGAIPTYLCSAAESINDLGQIVGTVGQYYLYEPSTSRACLFDPTGNGNNIDLNSLIDPSSGWVLKYAYGINNSGWIVGEGVHNGETRAFLLTPDPATLLLFSLGGLVLRRKK